MEYAYAARDIQGAKVSGILHADTEAEVFADLMGRALTPLKVTARTSRLATAVDFSKFVSVPLNAQLLFFSSMAFMLNAPVPMGRALAVASDRCDNKKYAEALRGVMSDVKNGVAFWRALQRRPRQFTPLQTAMARAGEAAGALPEVLESISVMLDNEYAINQKVKGAITQPAIIFFIGLICIIGVFIGVVPKMQELLSALHTPLPPPTVFVLWLSQVMLTPIFWIIAIGGSVGGFFGFRKGMENPDFAYRFSQVMRTIPIIGELSNQIVVARVARILGTLLGANVPSVQALELVEPLAGGEMYRRALVNIGANVREGMGLAEAFEAEGVWDPLLISMIGIGQTSGGVHDMLTQVAIYLDREVKKKLEALTKTIEPIASVFIGASIGGILMALYLPYYSMLQGFTNGGAP